MARMSLAMTKLALALVGLATVLVEPGSAQFVCYGDRMLCASGPVSWVFDGSSNTTTEDTVFQERGAQGFLMHAYKPGAIVCEDGIVIGADNLMHPKSLHSTILFICLAFCFLGIAIISDRFMMAIECITAQEKTVSFRTADGETKEVSIAVWNETVANLTLMALGSSAPEILLAVIETVSTLGQPPEDGLGTSTIVGSAAFNLFIIVAICVAAIPRGEKRQIKELGVFAVTASFSILAYVWMLVVLQWSSEGVVEWWEALATLLMFPILVTAAYYQDRGCCKKKKKIHPTATWMAGTGGMGASGYGGKDVAEMIKKAGNGKDIDPAKIDEEALAATAAAHIAQNRRSTIASYHVQATKSFMGGGKSKFQAPKLEHQSTRRIMLPLLVEVAEDEGEGETKESDIATPLPPMTPMSPSRAHKDRRSTGSTTPCPEGKSWISLTSPTYSVFENEGDLEIKVIRGGSAEPEVKVAYETSNGTAVDGHDYKHTMGELTFLSGERSMSFKIPIIDDNQYEPDRSFFISIRVPFMKDPPAVMGKYRIAEVTIIDDDKPGVFSFEDANYAALETDGGVDVTIVRKDGGDGVVSIHYFTEDTKSGAVAGEDYEPQDGVVEFGHGELKKIIHIPITNDHNYEKDETFTIGFEIEDYPECGAEYGETKQALITITSDEDFKRMVDKVAVLINLNLDKLKISTDTWGEQFKEAMQVGGGDEEDPPSASDYIMHFLTFFWKVLFAFIPPTSYRGGWLTFTCSLIMIGLLTAIVGDLASIFGCTLGVPNAVTAITFVALGTSLPDTFASRSAAVNDRYADASIGNVTGSNSVNVFLGLGLPWTIAAIYHGIKGTEYKVPSGTLSFSVYVFCACAVFCIGVIFLRRLPAFGAAELGGPNRCKWLTTWFFVLLWIIYVVLSSLKAVGVF